MKIKDKKIQFYLPVQNDSVSRRSFPYSPAAYFAGGLWAYVRCLRASEKLSFGATVNDEVYSAELNYNTVIDGRYKAIYRGAVYDVSPADTFEGYVGTTKFTLTRSYDNTEYSGDIFTGG